MGPGPLPWRPDGPPCRRKQQRQCRRPCAKGRSNAFVSFCLIQNHVMRGSVAVIGVLHGSSSVALLVCRIFARNGHGCIIAEASGPVQRRKKGVIPHFRAKTVLWPAWGSPQARFAPPWRPRAFSCHPSNPCTLPRLAKSVMPLATQGPGKGKASAPPNAMCRPLCPELFALPRRAVCSAFLLCIAHIHRLQPFCCIMAQPHKQAQDGEIFGKKQKGWPFKIKKHKGRKQKQIRANAVFPKRISPLYGNGNARGAQRQFGRLA